MLHAFFYFALFCAVYILHFLNRQQNKVKFSSGAKPEFSSGAKPEIRNGGGAVLGVWGPSPQRSKFCVFFAKIA